MYAVYKDLSVYRWAAVAVDVRCVDIKRSVVRNRMKSKRATGKKKKNL